MNKIALSLLATLALAVHLNWRDSTLARSFSQAQRSTAAAALSSFKVPDVLFKIGESPFASWYWASFEACNQAPRTPQDIKRSDKDPKYWESQIQKCVDEFTKEYNNTPLIAGLLDRLEGESHFQFHTADLGHVDATARAGLQTFAAPSDTVQESKDVDGAKYLTIQVMFHEPKSVTYTVVFADKYSVYDVLLGSRSVDETAIYLPDTDNYLQRLPYENLEDSILNDAAQHGESATDWKEAYRHLRVSTQTESYKLPLLDVEAPASIVAAMLLLIACGSMNQLRYAIRRSRLKAIADNGSDEAFWLTTFKHSPFLRLGYRLVFVTPLIVLWLSFEVWSRNGFTANRPLAISAEIVFALALAIEAWICISSFQQFLSTEVVPKDTQTAPTQERATTKSP
jgi:hypothetical protein